LRSNELSVGTKKGNVIYFNGRIQIRIKKLFFRLGMLYRINAMEAIGVSEQGIRQLDATFAEFIVHFYAIPDSVPYFMTFSISDRTNVIGKHFTLSSLSLE